MEVRSLKISFPLAGRWPVLLIVAVGLLTLLIVRAQEPFTLSPELLSAVETNYGAQAKQRLLDWQELIRHDKGTTDLERLHAVNDFFNQVQFISDQQLWRKNDYWATPVEFLVQNGGDCEDFSIAKYFTLKKLGIAEAKLNLTYVKALELNQAHMVLTYFDTPDAEPLVLDNLNPEILPASMRHDLMPVFSFNGRGLWLAKERSRGKMVGSSDRYKQWMDLLQRMPDGLD